MQKEFVWEQMTNDIRLLIIKEFRPLGLFFFPSMRDFIQKKYGGNTQDLTIEKILKDFFVDEWKSYTIILKEILQEEYRSQYLKSNPKEAEKLLRFLKVWEMNVEMRSVNNKLYPERFLNKTSSKSDKFWMINLQQRLYELEKLGIDTDFIEVQSLFSKSDKEIIEKSKPILEERLMEWIDNNIELNEQKIRIRVEEVKRKIFEKVVGFADTINSIIS